jgi:hypothetical protein
MKTLFDPNPIHVGFLADKVALGQFLRRVIRKTL